jgi:hypothetical protein
VNSEGLLALIRTGGRLLFVSAVLAVVSAVSALSFSLAVTRVMSIYHLSPRTEQPPRPTLKPPYMLSLWVGLASVSSTVLSYEAFEAEEIVQGSLP